MEATVLTTVSPPFPSHMFWTAVRGGVAVLGSWQVWLVAVSAALVVLGFQVLVTALATRGGEKTQTAGCLTTIIGGTLVQGVVMSVLFALVLPIVLGGTELMPISAITANLGSVAWIGLLGMVAGLLAAFIPGVGRLTAVTSFVQGVVICRLLVGGLLEAEASRLGLDLTYPGILASIGFLLIAWTLSLITLAAIAGVAAMFSSDTERSEERPGIVSMPLLQGIGTLSGCLPVFMYMRYTALSIGV